MTGDLLERARAGDGDAFQELIEPYRRELQVHCYRMLGSLQDAEDVLQETLMAAWQGLGGFEERASIRTWLYRIATNRCLNARRAVSRRPAKEWDIAAYQPPEPTRLGEIVWLEPFPDALLEGVMDVPLGPEARYERAEIDVPGLRDRTPDPAATTTGRARPARRPRFPRERGSGDARLDDRFRQQPPQTGTRRPAAMAVDRVDRERAPAPTHPPSRQRWRSSFAHTRRAISMP